MDLIAWAMTTVAFILNRVASENFITTMTLRESAVRIGGLVGYKLHNPIPATVQCEAALSSAATATTQLATGTVINVPITGGNLTYELTADYFIDVGDTTPEQIVLTVSPTGTGPTVLNTQFTATVGSENLVLVDTTVDLTTYVAAGQYVLQIGASDSNQHRIIDIIPTATSTEPCVLVIDPPWGSTASWNETTGNISVTVIERRVTFVQGQTVNESYTLPSAASPGYVIRLGQTPVIDDSVTVTVNGSVWSVIDSLSLADSQAQNVEVKILSSGQSSVIFGDGIFGALPPISGSVSIKYRICNGAAGNINVNVINTTLIGQQPSGQVTVTVSNTWSPGQGGMDQESLAQARNNIPAFVQTNGRGVTTNDYAALAALFSDPIFGSVSYARAVCNSVNSLLEGNVVTIYAWTTGPTGGLIPLSPSLQSSLAQYMATIAVGTDYVIVLDGTTTPAPIALMFEVSTGFTITTVANSITASIISIINANTPGDPIIFSNMVAQLNAISGVAALNIGTPLADLAPASSLEIFLPPDDTFQYTITSTQVNGNTYQGIVPISPLTAWCFNVTVGSSQMLIIPDNKPGFARLVDTTGMLANYDVGLLANLPQTINVSQTGDFFYATDTQQLYRADTVLGSSLVNPTLFWNPVSVGGSYVELATGTIVVSFKGDPQTITLSLITAQGYDTTRTISLFINYSGNNSLNVRNQIRSALRSWGTGLGIGDAIFANAITGANGQILLAVSRANVNDVVLSVPGVTGVNSVSLGSAANSAIRVDAGATELLKIGSITVNGNANS